MKNERGEQKKYISSAGIIEDERDENPPDDHPFNIIEALMGPADIMVADFITPDGIKETKVIYNIGSYYSRPKERQARKKQILEIIQSAQDITKCIEKIGNYEKIENFRLVTIPYDEAVQKGIAPGVEII